MEASRIQSLLRDLSYPIMRTDAAVQLQDVSLDGLEEDRSLGAYVSETDTACFDSVETLCEELSGVLPEEIAAEFDSRDA